MLRVADCRMPWERGQWLVSRDIFSAATSGPTPSHWVVEESTPWLVSLLPAASRSKVQVVHPDAAAIDIGARFYEVATTYHVTAVNQV